MSSSKEFFHYQGASYLVLLRIFSLIKKETSSFDLVDIGCGKGRALFVAESCGYDKLTGIELDEELLVDAQQNLKTYSQKRKESYIDFIHANALEYMYKNKPTVYFLFNPFNEEVMRKVLQRIKASTTSETWFVYANPLYTGPFKEMGLKKTEEFKTRFYTEAVIYRMN